MRASVVDEPIPLTRSAGRNERRLLQPMMRIAAASVWRGLGRSIDRRHGIDTEEARWPGEMSVVGANGIHGCEYSASPARTFWLSAGSLRIDAARFTIVDIGSGKGRVLLLAGQMPFRSIAGVEFAGELNAIAARNLDAVFPEAAERARFTLHTIDAAEYAFPDGPCVVYLYNPFGPALVQQVADRLVASYRAAPREIFVVYVNPRHRAVFDRFPFRQVESAWYARLLDRSVPYGFALYRLHEKGAQAASAT